MFNPYRVEKGAGTGRELVEADIRQVRVHLGHAAIHYKADI